MDLKTSDFHSFLKTFHKLLLFVTLWRPPWEACLTYWKLTVAAALSSSSLNINWTFGPETWTTSVTSSSDQWENLFPIWIYFKSKVKQKLKIQSYLVTTISPMEIKFPHVPLEGSHVPPGVSKPYFENRPWSVDWQNSVFFTSGLWVCLLLLSFLPQDLTTGPVSAPLPPMINAPTVSVF